jgi:hypothetical protein
VALRVATAALSLLQQAPGGSYSQVVAVTAKASNTPGSSSSSSKPVSAVSLLPPSAEDRAVLLSYALKVMLYQRPSSGNKAPPTPLGLAIAAAAAAAAASNAPAAAAAAAVPPPAGLSVADVALLEEKGVPSQEALVRLKLGLLALLAGAAAGMPGNASAAAASAAGATASSKAGAPGAPALGVPGNASSAAAAAGATASSKGGAAAGGSGAADGGAAAAMEVDAQQGEGAEAVAPAAVYLSSEELLLVLLAASCDPYEAVARWVRSTMHVRTQIGSSAQKVCYSTLVESRAAVRWLCSQLQFDIARGSIKRAAHTVLQVPLVFMA